MLGRTANDLFWLARYMERAENMARLIEVGMRIALLPPNGSGQQEEWRSTLQSAGCAERYFSKHAAVEARAVINHLLLDGDNPSSVRSCLATARRNARAQRTALTREMWECLNDSWNEFKTIPPSRITSDELLRLLDWIKQRSAMYRGALLNTILRNDTFYFSQLGTFIERADNTARILDVKYYVLLPQVDMVGSRVDNRQWTAILRSVSAHRSYRWVYRESYKPWRIAEYLILNTEMPRSLKACYREIEAALEGLSTYYGGKHPCHATAAGTASLLASSTISGIVAAGLHEFLLGFVARNTQLGDEVSEAYHFVS